MANEPVKIDYNQDFEPLEELLTEIKRPGNFFVHGVLEVPIPQLEIENVGRISFPVPDSQSAAIIKEATLAPYGRGEETILDTSVRKVRQLPPAKVRLGGKSWPENFSRILSLVTDGLGCGKTSVTAELYKLLVYEEGGFFLSHRDTEKTEGMFGTLVIVLPSAHRGGELVVRHAGRETTIDLSNAEMSEISFAAFYADCEHEVKPIQQGNRLCLVYNLIQPRETKSKGRLLSAPNYETEIAKLASWLQTAMTEKGSPVKIAWLLEHQYSPAGLSFSALKNADAARAKVLSEAASRAGCVTHLGIVHIEETGAAEAQYDPYCDRRSRWNRYDDDEDESSEETSEDFEIIEVCDWNHFVDEWIALDDRRVEFGRIPLEEGELLPDGALDDEKPDQQRLMEASGNEGATFERSYHRAALVIWHRERYPEVLLQGGVGAGLPYLQEQISTADFSSAESTAKLRALAHLVLDRWENPVDHWSSYQAEKNPDRSKMLGLIHQLGDSALLERFIARILAKKYDGTENVKLAAAVSLLSPEKTGELISILLRAHMKGRPGRCANLLRRLVGKNVKLSPWQTAMQQIASAVIAGMAEIDAPATPPLYNRWGSEPAAPLVDSEFVADLFDAMRHIENETLRNQAVAGIVSRPAVFEPARVIAPALSSLRERHGNSTDTDDSFHHLWRHASEFLLNRSEHPPEMPQDWRQEATISCQCENCRVLQKFILDGQSQVCRFRVRKELRQHLHGVIERHNLDMTHVTDRKGSPQTLVCTKTRRAYDRRREQYRKDIAAMKTLVDSQPNADGETAKLAARLTVACKSPGGK